MYAICDNSYIPFLEYLKRLSALGKDRSTLAAKRASSCLIKDVMVDKSNAWISDELGKVEIEEGWYLC